MPTIRVLLYASVFLFAVGCDENEKPRTSGGGQVTDSDTEPTSDKQCHEDGSLVGDCNNTSLSYEINRGEDENYSRRLYAEEGDTADWEVEIYDLTDRDVDIWIDSSSLSNTGLSESDFNVNSDGVVTLNESISNSTLSGDDETITGSVTFRIRYMDRCEKIADLEEAERDAYNLGDVSCTSQSTDQYEVDQTVTVNFMIAVENYDPNNSSTCSTNDEECDSYDGGFGLDDIVDGYFDFGNQRDDQILFARNGRSTDWKLTIEEEYSDGDDLDFADDNVKLISWEVELKRPSGLSQSERDDFEDLHKEIVRDIDWQWDPESRTLTTNSFELNKIDWPVEGEITLHFRLQNLCETLEANGDLSSSDDCSEKDKTIEETDVEVEVSIILLPEDLDSNDFNINDYDFEDYDRDEVNDGANTNVLPTIGCSIGALGSILSQDSDGLEKIGNCLEDLN